MCLGVPARVIDVREDENGLRVARVEIGGVSRDVVVVTSEDIHPGDYVIVHAGMAISRINEDELESILELWREISREIV